jgi:bifunctional DNase/RNase
LGWRSRVKWCLLGCLIGVLALVGASALVPAGVANTVGIIAGSTFASRARAVKEQRAVIEDTLIEMDVEAVGLSGLNNQPVVILKEKAGERCLPIAIGLFEASAISVAVEGLSVPRPLSADLTCSIMDELGTSVDSVTINDIQDNTFYANIVLVDSWTRIEIDSRPSDAIAIALRVGAPVYVEEAVLQEAGILPEQDSNDAVPVVLHPSSAGTG